MPTVQFTRNKIIIKGMTGFITVIVETKDGYELSFEKETQ